MDNRAKFLANEVGKIQKICTTTGTLVQARQQELEQNSKEVAELNDSVKATVNEVSEAKAKVWEMQTNTLNLMRQNREARATCFQRGQEIDRIRNDLKDCEDTLKKVAEGLPPHFLVQELERAVADLEAMYNAQYEKEALKLSQREKEYELEEEKMDRQLLEMQGEIKKLDEEGEELDRGNAVLKRICEVNGTRLAMDKEENERLERELEEKRALLEKDRAETKGDKENIRSQREQVEKETVELLALIGFKEEEYKKLQEKDATRSAEMLISNQKKKQYNAILEKLQTEINTLLINQKCIQFRHKMVFKTSTLYGYKCDDSLPEEKQLNQCAAFLKTAFGLLTNEKLDLEKSTKYYEEQIQNMIQSKREIIKLTEETEKRIEQWKSDHLVYELQHDKIQLEIKHQTDKWNTELAALRERVNSKEKMLQALNDEIKHMESSSIKQDAEFAEKQKELDKELERVTNENRQLLEQLVISTEKMRKLDKECSELSYDLVKLDNKKAQLEKEPSILQLRPQSQTVKVQRRFHEISTDSDSDFFCAIKHNTKKRRIGEVKQNKPFC